MQSPYEMANNSTLYQEQNHLTIDDGPSSILHTPPNILTPNHIHHSILQHYHNHYSESPHNTQQQNQGWKEQCHQDFYQSHQNEPHKFQPHQQQTHSLGDNIVNRYVECEGSTATVSFWKAFNNTVQSDSTEKCLVSDNNFGELEAVYKYKLGRNHQAAFIEKHDDSKRKARKKRRKKRLKEEMSMMNTFFKRLTKSMVNHQEVLQNKLLEVIERMEKERIEREENWRREENEIYEREAIVNAREILLN